LCAEYYTMQKTTFKNIRVSHYPRGTVIVTSRGIDGRVGATTISWTGVVSSQPPTISVSFLPDSYTRLCILESREFVVNVPSEDLLVETNHLGSLSGPWESKLKALQEKNYKSLSLVDSSFINSPQIAECYLAFECRLMQTIQVGLYDCFLGQIISMNCTSSLFSNHHPRGHIQYSDVSPIFCLADEYWSSGTMLGKSTENKKHPHGETH
jgi:flavin reductase (DIM6/NTAB) family NADH-FMN oxidoreductase RutF